MSEDDLQEEVRRLTKERRLLTFHCADSRRSWGPGFPDLLVVGPGGVLYRELKSATGTLSSDQTTWKWALMAAGANWGLWRPADLMSGRIARELSSIAS